MPDGYTIDYWTTGSAIFCVTVVLANVEIVFMHHVHSLLIHFVIWFSIMSFFMMFYLISEFMEGTKIYLSFKMLLNCPGFYFYMIFVIYSCAVFTNSIVKTQRIVEIAHQNRIITEVATFMKSGPMLFKRKFNGYAFSK